MNNKKLTVSIRLDFTDKATKEELSRSGRGWTNNELDLKQFVDHIKSGFPFTHQFFGGKKTKEHFQQTNVLVADIDAGMTVEQALDDEFIKAYGTLIYTTPRHTQEQHRFRIVFVLDRLIFNPNLYESMYAGLMMKIPATDPNVRSAAQFFQGCSTAQVWMLNGSMPDPVINKLINDGDKCDLGEHTPPRSEKLTPKTLVLVKNKGLHELQMLDANTSISCPFGTHTDKNPSAFVMVNKQGVRGVQCRSCGQKGWSEPLGIDDQFGYFDRLVTDLSKTENSHFPYQGLTRFDHTLETSMGKSNFHLSNSKHVELAELLPGIHLIKSPKGTGKTVLMSSIVNRIREPNTRKKLGLSKDDRGRTILIGHRQTLIRESAQKLGLECYLDTGGYDTKIDVISKLVNGSPVEVERKTRKPQHYAVCLDSLSSRVRPEFEQYDVVIVDESEQVFSHFLSDHMAHPSSNFDVLSKLLKRAKLVFLLDADLDRVTLTGVLACLSTSNTGGLYPDRQKHEFQKLYCHLNTFVPDKRKLQLFTSKNHLQNDLISNIKAGKRCFVTSNSKKFVEGLHDACVAVFKDKSFELVVSDRGDDEVVRHFLKNIKTEILTKDALFSSPSIGTGIDITFPENSKQVDVVYGFFDTNVNTHFDIDQQLGRVRHPGQVKVWVSPTRGRKSTDIETIRQEILFDKKVEGLQYYLDQNGAHASMGQHPFVDLLSTVIATRRQSMNRLRDNFIQHKQKTGWEIEHLEHNELMASKGKVIGQASRVSRTKNIQSRLLAAPDITDAQRLKLEAKKEKNLPMTDDEKTALNKYWIKHFYRQEVTQELLDFDDEGKTREKITLLERVINPKNKLVRYQDIDVEKAMVIESKLTPDQLRKPVLMREMLIAAGVFDSATMSFLTDVTYTTESLAQFVKLLKSKKVRDRFAYVFDKEVNANLEEKPIFQVGALLRMVGLGQKVVKSNKGGGMSVYQIDQILHSEIMGIVRRRASQKPPKTTRTEIGG
jgi:hypothetical protein